MRRSGPAAGAAAPSATLDVAVVVVKACLVAFALYVHVPRRAGARGLWSKRARPRALSRPADEDAGAERDDGPATPLDLRMGRFGEALLGERDEDHQRQHPQQQQI